MLDTPRNSTDNPQDHLPASAAKRGGPDDPPKSANYPAEVGKKPAKDTGTPDDPPEDVDDGNGE
jgi:hypothetical protein